MRQHHFAVYIEMGDDGRLLTAQVDDSIDEFGMGRGFTVWNSTRDEWEEPDKDADIGALALLSLVIERGLASAFSPGHRSDTDASRRSP
jgi:hypothetical protein